MTNDESMSPEKFWRKLFPTFGADLEAPSDWSMIIQALRYQHESWKDSIAKLVEKQINLDAFLNSEYNPRIGPLLFRCSSCHGSQVWIERVKTIHGSNKIADDEPVEGTHLADWEHQWPDRGVAIELQCGCEQRVRFRVQEHKGEILLLTESMVWSSVRSGDDQKISASALRILEGLEPPEASR